MAQSLSAQVSIKRVAAEEEFTDIAAYVLANDKLAAGVGICEIFNL